MQKRSYNLLLSSLIVLVSHAFFLTLSSKAKQFINEPTTLTKIKFKRITKKRINLRANSNFLSSQYDKFLSEGHDAYVLDEIKSIIGYPNYLKESYQFGSVALRFSVENKKLKVLSLNSTNPLLSHYILTRLLEYKFNRNSPPTFLQFNFTEYKQELEASNTISRSIKGKQIHQYFAGGGINILGTAFEVIDKLSSRNIPDQHKRKIESIKKSKFYTTKI